MQTAPLDVQTIEQFVGGHLPQFVTMATTVFLAGFACGRFFFNGILDLLKEQIRQLRERQDEDAGRGDEITTKILRMHRIKGFLLSLALILLLSFAAYGGFELNQVTKAMNNQFATNADFHKASEIALDDLKKKCGPALVKPPTHKANSVEK